MPANLENSAVATGLEKIIFIPISKKGNAKNCSNYCTIAHISQATKVVIKVLQQYVNYELPDAQAGFRKGRRTRDQNASICWILGKGREFQKNIYFCITDYAKTFDCVDHDKLWKILKEMEIPDHLTCLLRNQVKKQHLELDMEQWTGSKLGKESIKAVYCYPDYLNYMHHAKCQAG